MRRGAHMHRRLAPLDERHAGLAAGEEDRVDRAGIENLSAGGFRGGVVRRADSGELRHLLGIGRDQRRAGKDRRRWLLRIDDHRDAGLPCRRDQPADRLRVEHALAVVGEDDDAALAHRLFRRRDDRRGDVAGHRVRLLRVDAEQLVPAAEIARLDRGRPPGIGDETLIERRMLLADRLELFRRLVLARHPDKRDMGAIGDEIGGDVAGATEQRPRGAIFQDRDRCLR
jgi:hypothetical protein